MKSEEDLQQAIFAAIEAANSRLMDQGIGAGTTVAVAEIIDGTLRSYHVGDSEVVVVGQRGKVKGRIIPHSPTGFAIETGLISEDEAKHHPDRNCLTSVLGGDKVAKVDCPEEPLEIQKGDILLVSSDGLQFLSNDEIEEIVLDYRDDSANDIAARLLDAVLSLEVTPQITPDDRVIMDLKINKDNPDFTRAVLGVPPVDTREIETSVLVDNGETVVLGGVFERTKSDNIQRVPFFGDLPYVGFMFKQHQVQDENSELLIFVTPKILKDTLTLR